MILILFIYYNMIYTKIINYCIYIFYLIISLFILHNINKILCNIFSDKIVNLILELGILVVQADNFSLLYDYNNLKAFYEKLINDEYRINKLTKISNNLLERYSKLEANYFELLNSNNINKNKIKLLNIDIFKYISLYNRFEYKLNILKNKLNSSKSEIFDIIRKNKIRLLLTNNKKKIRLVNSKKYNNNLRLLVYNYDDDNNKNELRLLHYHDNDYHDIFNSTTSSNSPNLDSSISDSPVMKPFSSTSTTSSNSPNLDSSISDSPVMKPFRYIKKTQSNSYFSSSKSFSIINKSETFNNYDIEHIKNKSRLYKSETNLDLCNNLIEDFKEEIKSINHKPILSKVEPKKIESYSLNINQLYESFI